MCLKDVIKKGDMHSIFEIHNKRPEFDRLSACDSIDLQSDDEFVLI
jgi:hypothetical protein